MVYHDKNSLGQNFIKYPSLVAELLDISEISHDDVIVEIGPGKGIITYDLVRRAKKVIAIEKDNDLVDGLKEKFKDRNNLEIVNEDFMEYRLPIGDYKIIANIPFGITSEIVNKILKSDNMPRQMYLIMQKEAADKFQGGVTETQSSVLTKPWFEVEILGEIDRTNFTLKPQVKIVYTKFTLRDRPFIKDEDLQLFRNFVIFGFSQWKPTVMEAYKEVITRTQIITIKKTLKINNEKPSELSFDKWLLLFKTFRRIASEDQISRLKRLSRQI